MRNGGIRMQAEKSKGGGSGAAGFALILAILALMLLTFLGLTLATMTSTELQIATNYRWSQQALYNAEAGLEYGKALLRNMNWSLILPDAPAGRRRRLHHTPPTGRSSAGGPPTPRSSRAFPPRAPPYARPDPHGNPTRNFENSRLRQVRRRHGVTAWCSTTAAASGPVPERDHRRRGRSRPSTGRSRSGYAARSCSTPTAASRTRPRAATSRSSSPSEGTAPYTGENSNLAMTQTNRAIRVLEATLVADPVDAVRHARRPGRRRSRGIELQPVRSDHRRQPERRPRGRPRSRRAHQPTVSGDQEMATAAVLNGRARRRRRSRRAGAGPARSPLAWPSAMVGLLVGRPRPDRQRRAGDRSPGDPQPAGEAQRAVRRGHLDGHGAQPRGHAVRRRRRVPTAGSTRRSRRCAS